MWSIPVYRHSFEPFPAAKLTGWWYVGGLEHEFYFPQELG